METFLYDEGRFAPFARLAFDPSQTPAGRKVEQILLGAPELVTQVPDLVQELIQTPVDGDGSSSVLGSLFKAGLSDPAAVLAAFPDIMSAPCFRGGEASLASMMKEELELLDTS